ncbi:serine protease 23-like [Glandiceps talaboti]
MLFTVLFVSTFLPAVLGVSAIKEEDQWPSTSIPNLKVKNVIDRGLADFSGVVPKKLKTNCNLQCMAEKMQRLMESDRLDEMVSYETLYENGSVVLTEISVDKSTLFNARQPESEEETPEISRQKREVYGYDTRFLLTDKEYLGQYPFNAVVKLSTGCTGTLISQKYVLTAAQCVHDGVKYVKGAKQLKIGFRRDRTFEEGPLPSDDEVNEEDKDFYWIRGSEIKVPQGWMSRRGRDSEAEYDYAVIRLKRPHDKDFMDFGITGPSLIYPGRRLHFSAFDDDNSTDLMYRFCPVGDSNNDMVYHFCDSKPMAAGAGLYIRLWDSLERDWKRKIMAVFSGHVWVEDIDAVGEYNAAVLITPLKYAQICFWLEGDFSSCRGGDE